MSSRQRQEQLMLGIFGRTENLSKIQRMFARASYYVYENFQNRKAKDHINFTKALDDLDAAIEENMPKSTSPDYNRYIAMKAISYTYRAHIDFTVNREYTEKALVVLDPIKSTPEGIGVYITSVIDISKVTHDGQKVLAYLNDGMAAIDEFEKTGKEALQYAETFGGTSRLGVELIPSRSEWLNRHRNWLSVHLFYYHAFLNNEKMMEKLIFPALKGIYRGELSMHSTLKNVEFKPVPTVHHLLPQMKYLIDHHYFAQVNHLVSVLMFHLVKNGRTAESSEELNMIDRAKAKVCFWYAKWAVHILGYTNNVVINPENSDVLAKPIRTEIVRFDLVVVPGVEQYENQFPVDVIESDKEWKKVIKNGKAWCQRSIDYMEKCRLPPPKVFKEDVTPAGLMLMFSFFKDKQIF